MGAVRALRARRGDDRRTRARAAFDQVGPAGRIGSDTEGLRTEVDVASLKVWIVGRSFEIGGKQAMRAVTPVRFDSVQEPDLGGSVCHA